ncbi:MAG TPA: DinB family protein [Bryobacteraceae bacterium]|nr:DinB family protein [Bryobacteraceae bacterium]
MTPAQQMTFAQAITLDFDDEMKSTRKLLERVPLDDAHRDYKPHEKSMPLNRLASHVAELPSWQKMALDTEVFDLPANFKPVIAGSTAELLEMFDKNVADAKAALAKATDDDLRKTWTFKFNGHHVFSAPRPNVLRSFINHLIHHRAQLGVYLRENNIPIPGMYGPSADDNWQPGQ